ncbi:MAG: (d)CMP kinase [Phycisphaerales bacterium]
MTPPTHADARSDDGALRQDGVGMPPSNPKRSAPRPVVITIDGPAGTGKSSVAGRLAQRLGLEFLDTGAMYRAAALLAIERGIAPSDGAAIAAAVIAARLRFVWGLPRPALVIEGTGALAGVDRDISERIRDLDVSAVVSVVASCAEVRAVMVAEQRRIAAEHPRLVTEGRDQGSVVFPDAAVRFFLDADPTVRAARRLAQIEATGKRVEAEAVIDDIARRDRLDASRAEGPLVRPVGAIEVDTTALSLEEVVERLESIVRERLPAGALGPGLVSMGTDVAR